MAELELKCDIPPNSKLSFGRQASYRIAIRESLTINFILLNFIYYNQANMKKPSARQYRSSIRDDHTAQTRERIIAASLSYLRTHEPDTLTLPGLGKLAGVSAPTVYAHFPTVDDLYLGIYKSMESRLGLGLDQYPQHIEELTKLPKIKFPAYGRNARALRALLLSPAYHRVRQGNRRDRMQRWVTSMEAEMPNLTPPQARLGAAAANAFWVPGMWHWLTANCGLTAEEAIRVATWATASLIDALKADAAGLDGGPAQAGATGQTEEPVSDQAFKQQLET